MENLQQVTEKSPPLKPSGGGTPVALVLAVSVVTFLAGLIIGFLGRPAIVPDAVMVVTATPDATAIAQTQVTPTVKPQGTIMDTVLADARHSQGDINAPVTIVEFSDFK